MVANRGKRKADLSLPDYGKAGAFLTQKQLEVKGPAELCAWLAEHLLGLVNGEYEFLDHAGNGFCWGSAVLSAFMPGMIADNNRIAKPFTSWKALAGCGFDRKVEAMVRDMVWSSMPPPFKPAPGAPFPPPGSLSAWVESEAIRPQQLRTLLQVRV